MNTIYSDEENLPTAELQNLADSIRQEFRNQWEARHLRKWKPQPRHDSNKLWLKAAENCAACGADPNGWVFTCFANNPLCVMGPYPSMLTGKAMKRWWEERNPMFEYEDGKPTKTAVEQEIQDLLAYYATLPSDRDEDCVTTMLNESLGVPPLIRVLLCDNPEVREKFGKRAYVSLASNPAAMRAVMKMCDISWMDKYAE